ncbi:MAG: glycerol-3-phosphate 1-O-acyltransferase PlsY [Bacteroidales bacterium]|nr:glycerol-3-phosphate 1-O-acyltransferase PlsY [Bacteroidales bacterium]
MDYFLLILFIILAFLIGSIPSSVWIGRIFFKVDIRKMGSGNAGATNTIRVLGWKAGVPVLLIDIFKGWIAVYIANFLPFEFVGDQFIYFKIILATSAVLGHIFPIYIGFKGGKGVATLLGVGIALFPLASIIIAGLFLIVLFISRIVSVSSIIASIAFPIVVIFILKTVEVPLIILSIAVAVFIPLTHAANIKRIFKGEEKKF